MNFRIRNAPISVKPHNSDLVRVDIDISDEITTTATLGLVLLRDELVDAIVFEGAKATRTITIRVVDSRQVCFTQIGRDQFEFALSKDEVDHLTLFLLRHYRDGLAPVDHVDFEAPSGRGRGCLTVSVPRAANPMTAKQARKELGL